MDRTLQKTFHVSIAAEAPHSFSLLSVYWSNFSNAVILGKNFYKTWTPLPPTDEAFVLNISHKQTRRQLDDLTRGSSKRVVFDDRLVLEDILRPSDSKYIRVVKINEDAEIQAPLAFKDLVIIHIVSSDQIILQNENIDREILLGQDCAVQQFQQGYYEQLESIGNAFARDREEWECERKEQDLLKRMSEQKNLEKDLQIQQLRLRCGSYDEFRSDQLQASSTIEELKKFCSSLTEELECIRRDNVDIRDVRDILLAELAKETASKNEKTLLCEKLQIKVQTKKTKVKKCKRMLEELQENYVKKLRERERDVDYLQQLIDQLTREKQRIILKLEKVMSEKNKFKNICEKSKRRAELTSTYLPLLGVAVSSSQVSNPNQQTFEVVEKFTSINGFDQQQNADQAFIAQIKPSAELYKPFQGEASTNEESENQQSEALDDIDDVPNAVQVVIPPLQNDCGAKLSPSILQTMAEQKAFNFRLQQTSSLPRESIDGLTKCLQKYQELLLTAQGNDSNHTSVESKGNGSQQRMLTPISMRQKQEERTEESASMNKQKRRFSSKIFIARKGLKSDNKQADQDLNKRSQSKTPSERGKSSTPTASKRSKNIEKPKLRFVEIIRNQLFKDDKED